MAANTTVYVYATHIDIEDKREIKSRYPEVLSLTERSAEIKAAISETVDILRQSATFANKESSGWRVDTLEASFSVTLAAEAGVMVTKASAEACFEVTITLAAE